MSEQSNEQEFKCADEEKAKRLSKMLFNAASLMPMYSAAVAKPIQPLPRPVKIKFDVEGDKRGLFLGWFQRLFTVVNGTYETALFGIIELPSGEVITIKSSDFVFLDSQIRFNQLIWFDDKKYPEQERKPVSQQTVTDKGCRKQRKGNYKEPSNSQNSE